MATHGRGLPPSFATDESSHSVSYYLNVGNLRDAGHSAEVMPPAAKAEHETFTSHPLNFRFGSKAAIRPRTTRSFQIDSCTHMGRWSDR